MIELPIISAPETSDIGAAVELFHRHGIVTVLNAVPAELIVEARKRLLSVRASQQTRFGTIEQYRDELEVRIPFASDLFFLKFLEIQKLIEIVDQLISPHSILRFQSGYVLPADSDPEVLYPQNRWHMNNGRIIAPGKVYSVETYFTFESGQEIETPVVYAPGFFNCGATPSIAELDAAAVRHRMPQNSFTVIDSTLWHRELGIAELTAEPTSDYLALVQQITKSYFKPHFDYCRGLGEDLMAQLPERTKIFLGYYTRVPETLEQFFLPNEQRLYRAGQD